MTEVIFQILFAWGCIILGYWVVVQEKDNVDTDIN